MLPRHRLVAIRRWELVPGHWRRGIGVIVREDSGIETFGGDCYWSVSVIWVGGIIVGPFRPTFHLDGRITIRHTSIFMAGVPVQWRPRDWRVVGAMRMIIGRVPGVDGCRCHER